MSSKTKKFTAVLFAFAAAVCMALALFFGLTPRTASAEGELTPVDGVLALTEENLAVDGNKAITGFKPEVAEVIASSDTKSYTLTIGGNSEDSATSIAKDAFKGQTKLTSLEITSAKLTAIGESAFAETAELKSIKLNNALKVIGKSAFAMPVERGNNNRLEEITIPENVESIGALAFAARTRLAVINFYAANCADFATVDGTNSISTAAANNPFIQAGLGLIGNAGVTVNIGTAADGASIKVKKIPAAMFIYSGTYNNKVTTVHFNNVELDNSSFGKYSFYGCSNLKEVGFLNSNSVASIGERAFSNCSSLNLVTLPEGLTEVGKESFYGSALSAITIPAAVKTIGESAFRNCSSLLSVGFAEGASIEKISDGAFRQCSALRAITTLPDSVTEIGNNAFQDCTNLRTFGIDGANSKLAKIGANTFNNCNSLVEIIIPAQVTSIGSNAYINCKAVQRINYNANIENFSGIADAHPFVNVGSEGAGIAVNINSVTKIPANMFYYSSSQLNVTNVNMSGVNAEIGENAFRNCRNLSLVTFASCNITGIKANAFSGCTSLTDFNMPDSVTEIGEGAFQNCQSILTITIPGSLDTIGSKAFNGCSRLFVVIDLRTGSSLEALEGSTIDGGVAANKGAVVIKGEGASPVISEKGLQFIQIGKGTDAKYYLIGAMSTVGDNLVLPNCVPQAPDNTSYDIFKYAFYNHANLTSITIPATVDVIQEQAFSGCTALETVKIADGVKEIGSLAFADCTALTTVTLPKTLDIIASELFRNCTALKHIDIPDGVTTIGSYSFNNTGLTSIEIPASVESISVSAFEGCNDLAKVGFIANEDAKEDENKYSLTNIGNSAFKGCSSLVYIVLPDTLTALDGEAFSGASELSTVYLPKHLTTYSNSAFNGCSKDLVIISSGKDAYAGDYDLLRSDRLTYVIKVDLVYGGTTHTVPKLYNPDGAKNIFDYSYERQPDGITWLKTAKKLPVMEGYASSNWYNNEGCTGIQLTESAITALLAGNQKITLYANYIARPSYVLKPLNYSDFAGEKALDISTDSLDTINDRLFNGNALKEEYNIVLVQYKPFIGNIQTSGLKSVQEAGEYTLSITIKDTETYGEWDEPFLLTFTVQRQIVDISNTDELNWVVNTSSGTSQLGSERLWIPVSGEGAPYIADATGMDENYQEVLVEYSVLHYSGRAWMLALADTSEVKYKIDYNNVTGNEVGIYTAEAVITPTNNYTLQTGAFKYGMSCKPNNAEDGSYIVSKVWYIVAIANTLWMPEGSARYHVDGWTYNEENIAGKIPGAPRLSYNNEVASALVTFSLSLEVDSVETDIISGARYNDFSSWINAAMPAGNYTLTINVESIDVEIAKMEEVYKFTVKKAPLDTGIAAKLVSDINDKLNGQELKYSYSGIPQIGYEEISEIVTSLNDRALNPNRVNTSEWWSSVYNAYYGSFSISYNISTMNNNVYMSAEQIANSQYATIKAGSYTVFYQLSAPNYELLVKSIDNKYDYRYNIVIYEELNVATLAQAGGYAYTGEIITPFTNNETYQVISLEAGEFLGSQVEEIRNLELSVLDRNYTDVGTPKIVLKISDPTIYKWQKAADDENVIFGANDEYLLLSFNVVRCQNSTTQALDIIRWSWGSYSASVNKPIWTTKFATDYTYTLTSATNGKLYTQEKFGEAPAGQYTFTATAAGGAGYNWEPYTVTTTINVLKANNYWDVVPSVYDWAYGEYATRVVGPAAKPHFGDASAIVTSYFKLDADGAVEGQGYVSLDKLCVDGEVPVGQYLMRVQLAGNSNYNSMAVTDVSFRVSQAYNGWIEVPYVIGWSEGHFNGLDNGLNKGSSKFGEVIIKITDSAGKEVKVDDFSKLSVGNYTVTAYVEGTDNYYEMQTITTTFAVVEDSVSMTGLIAATMVFAVLAVGLAVAAVVLLVLRSRKIEAEFRKMIKKELGRK